MRIAMLLILLLTAGAAPAVTPELGKSKLRRLVKLPTISFPPDWSFDAENGFRLGSQGGDMAARLEDLRRELTLDPGAADSYRQLGSLLAELNEPMRAQAARARAIQLYRRRVELQPDNAPVLREFGTALAEAGQSEEGESMLRRAVQLAPREWRGWLALGRLLDTESRRDIFERARVAPDARTGGRGLATTTGTILAPDRVALARRRLEEAGICYEAALTNGMDQAEIHLRRGLHRTLQSFLLNEIKEAAGEHVPETEILSGYFSPETVADLRRASELNPRDYRLMGNLALYEIYGMNARSGRKGLGTDSTWQTLPEGTQRSLRRTMNRLEELAEDPNTKVAAGALEILGILQGPVLHEPNAAVNSLERSLALDPTRSQAWELAAGTLARTGNYEELLNLCEDRLRREDTVRSHMLLAKAYEKLKRWEEAEAEILAVLRKSPEDFTGTLSLAALLLRRSDNPETLAEAGGWLQRCDKVYSSLTSAQKNRQQVIDFTLTRAIYLALTDDLDNARQWVNSIIENDKGNELAREIQSAMAY